MKDLQSRREFFKSAAKAALPVVGVVVLSTIPLKSLAVTGCNGTCEGGCMGSCSSSCTGSCSGGCKGTCEYSCAVGATRG
jgi:CXXX repeat radical SAM target protein